MTFEDERQSDQPAIPPADETAAQTTEPSPNAGGPESPAAPPIWRAGEAGPVEDGSTSVTAMQDATATPDAATVETTPPVQPGWPQPPHQPWPQTPAWPPAQQGWPHPQQPWSPQQPPQQPWSPQQPPQQWPPSPSWPPTQPTQPTWPPSQPTWPAMGYPAPAPASAGDRLSNRAPQILGLISAVMIAFAGGMVVEHLATPAAPAPTAGVGANQPLKDFAVYEQALQIIRDRYVGRSSVTDQQLLYGSISGMVDALGDTNHTRFLTPAQYKEMNSQLSGKVAGIGILVGDSSGTFVVARVIAGSPAEKAGMLAGDQIVAVDKTATSGLTFDQMAALIRGDPGTKVTVSVIHPGSTTVVDLPMTRALVSAPVVDWGMVPGTSVADIALFEFDNGAADEVDRAIKGAELQGAKAIVLDLRSDPGGLADEARWVASEFLKSGVVYIEEDGSGRQTKVSVDTSRTSTSLPMVVLVDRNTASAAEIVTGALQDADRAKVIGLPTVGTGTVLQPFELSDGSVVLLGVADWLTPAGHRIFGKGITPDETVAMPTGGLAIDPIDLAKMTHAQVHSSTDAELLAALKDLGY
jgi:carboxyl-terminal processing protease